MLAWIGMNIATIIVALIVALIVAAVICVMIKDKKKGVSPCGCNCKTCGGACHQGDK